MDEITFRHLLNWVTSIDEPSEQDIKKLCSYEKHATAEMAARHISVIIKLLDLPIFMESKSGRKFMGRIASLSQNVFNRVFEVINVRQSVCMGRIAVASGVILKYAWFKADHNMKAYIQLRFQCLIEQFISMTRTTLDLSKRGQNLLEIFEAWNVEVRKMVKDDFTKMITDCYQPIMWKYLQTGYPGYPYAHQRRNAADLFLKAFPLRIPGDASASLKLFQKQIELMTKVLRDYCWIVRAITTREILKILPVYWSEFTLMQINIIMNIVVHNNIDSPPEVKCMFWNGMTDFVKHSDGFLYFTKNLFALEESHHPNAEVRKAFRRFQTAIRHLERIR